MPCKAPRPKVQDAIRTILAIRWLRALFARVNTPPSETAEALPWEQLVAKAVHDMRSPLSTITTTLAVLRMAAADPAKSDRLIGILERQTEDLTEQLNRLVSDPGSFAKERAGVV